MKVGVPVVPGTPGPVGSYTEADDFIKEYGYEDGPAYPKYSDPNTSKVRP